MFDIAEDGLDLEAAVSVSRVNLPDKSPQKRDLSEQALAKLPRHQAELYRMFGEAADDILYPKMVEKKKRPMNQKLRKKGEHDEASDEEDQEDLELLLLFVPQIDKHSGMAGGDRFRIGLDSFPTEDFMSMFRFNKAHILQLLAELNIPEIHGYQKTYCSPLECLLVMLRRLTYPNRWADLSPQFGRSIPELSIIFREGIDFLYDHFLHKFSDLDQGWLGPQDIRRFADAIQDKGSPLGNVWGFIDGTLRPCTRPRDLQRELFSGHKRVHGIKFQSVMTPCGLISHLYGPIPGRRHDAYMLQQSNLLPQLEANMNGPNGEPFMLYGDAAYPLSQYLLGPFGGINVTPQERAWNESMSRVRSSVEWGFAKISTHFAFLNFKQDLKLFLQPIAKYYWVGALFTNCHTCLYGSTTGTYFDIQPPTLHEYLANE